MKADVVADVGNTRVKWGRRHPEASRIVEVVSLGDDPAAWQAQLDDWRSSGSVPAPAAWVLASVRPQRSEPLRLWLEDRGERVALLQHAAQLPLAVGVEHPDRVGIDRLLNAVAACRVLELGRPAVLVDAGSAVTVDWLDESHTFRGGAIFPGLRLMAEALHQHTALLPLVALSLPVPELPGPATTPAVQAGVFWAVVGGIDRVVGRLCRLSAALPRLFVTGGDGPFLLDALARHADAALSSLPATPWPEQTLEGILHAAESWP
jgi:type III pantothenate kinase